MPEQRLVYPHSLHRPETVRLGFKQWFPPPPDLFADRIPITTVLRPCPAPSGPSARLGWSPTAPPAMSTIHAPAQLHGLVGCTIRPHTPRWDTSSSVSATAAVPAAQTLGDPPTRRSLTLDHTNSPQPSQDGRGIRLRITVPGLRHPLVNLLKALICGRVLRGSASLGIRTSSSKIEIIPFRQTIIQHLDNRASAHILN